MMRKSLLVVLLLSTSLPSYAVKDNKTLDVLAEMKTEGIYDQRAVLRRFPKVLQQEGQPNGPTFATHSEMETAEISTNTISFLNRLPKHLMKSL